VLGAEHQECINKFPTKPRLILETWTDGCLEKRKKKKALVARQFKRKKGGAEVSGWESMPCLPTELSAKVWGTYIKTKLA